jgi:hypothetical protein
MPRMPDPKEICIEDLDAHDPDRRYLRCVALAGREPGLRVDARGAVLWKSEGDVACELWVSADERLVLFRPEGGGEVRVERGGRHLDVPCEKPVFLLHGDALRVGARRLKVHVHGVAAVVDAPAFVPSALLRAAAAASVAAAVSAAAAGCGGSDRAPVTPIAGDPSSVDAGAPPPPPPIDVRDAPPAPVPGPSPGTKPSPGR